MTSKKKLKESMLVSIILYDEYKMYLPTCKYQDHKPQTQIEEDYSLQPGTNLTTDNFPIHISISIKTHS